MLPDLLLKEVCLPLQGDVLHEVEGVGCVVHLVAIKLHQKPVGHELNVLHHEISVHTYEATGKSFCEELALNVDGVLDNLIDPLLAGFVHQVPEHEAGEVSVKSLVPRDQLIAEAQARHQTSLLQPENGGETAGEEYSLLGSEGHHPLGVSGVV